MRKNLLYGFLIMLGIAILMSGIAFAVGGYDLSWWTVDGGGNESTGGGYTIVGTIGQVDAGRMTGDGFILYGGFWHGGGGSQVYLPLVVR